MKKLIPYGIANYDEMVREDAYFVDKTPYLAQLEGVKNPVFLRPRRFGKTLFCSMLRHYYDLNQASRFAELLGHTWIGQNPTVTHNQYMVLALNFSDIATGPTLNEIEQSFRNQCNDALNLLRVEYASLLAHTPELNLNATVSDNLSTLLRRIRIHRLPKLYVVIDEYDNFANQLILNNKEQLYHELTAEGGFFKTFFKTLKKGREEGAIANIFITGILPMMIDDLASAYNIATFLTLDAHYESMLGFTEAEVTLLLDQIYSDYAFDPSTRATVATVIKNHYNGYHFVNPESGALYNSTILMMQNFVNRLNLEQLFAGYWTHYTAQLPEAIFTQVNENFYRTTFFELCSRYLSTWFTWNVERSYPQGKSDLEFVGKYHEAFADLRWVIEFKYYSNAEFKKLKTTLEKFALRDEDTTQIKGYAQGLSQEYPHAQVALYVIYCVGKQGFRVFPVAA